MSISQGFARTVDSDQYSTGTLRRYWRGDITALLTPEDEQATATIISRETMVLAGQPWVDALIQAYDPSVRSDLAKNDGDHVAANEAF